MYLCIIINAWNPVRFFSGSAPDTYRTQATKYRRH